jgi:putative RNA 2'-phosphotransferase
MKEFRLLQPMLEKASRWLIKALRHQPRMLNLPGKPMNFEEGGWAPIDHILKALNYNCYPVNRMELDWIVRSSNKQRFGISSDGSKIRANQGHSVQVDMKFVGVLPPKFLWHGTAIQFCPAIRAAGLSKMNRQHVHMSADTATATQVGSRHGQAVVLKIDAARMHADGFPIFCSENGVWLTDHVPQKFISRFPELDII